MYEFAMLLVSIGTQPTNNESQISMTDLEPMPHLKQMRISADQNLAYDQIRGHS